MKYNIFSGPKFQKRKFISLGIINFLATITILQLLVLHTRPIFAAFLSQSFNAIIGINIYGKFVFEKKGIRFSHYRKYMIMSLCLWITNTTGISILISLGTPRSMAAIIFAPVQVILSFVVQKCIVFKPIA